MTATENTSVVREMKTQIPESELIEMARQYPTPFHAIDKKTIQDISESFYKSFEWASGKGSSFRNFFAVKANPNPAIIKFLVDEMNMGCDCSSIGELILCEKLGVTGEKIMFTSNNTQFEEYRMAARLGAIINLDDYSQIWCLEKALRNSDMPFPKLISFRYNPGPRQTGNVLIGEPVEAKYGLTRNQLHAAYTKARELGANRFGLHTMVASNSTDVKELVATVREIFTLTVELKDKEDINIDFCNFGGGVGVAYRPEQTPISFPELGQQVKSLYEEIIEPRADIHPIPSLYYECGRVITGEAGCIVSRVINLKDTYKRYVGVDATMADLMRPGMYGAYHHITIIEDKECDRTDLPDFDQLLDNKEYIKSDFDAKKADRMYDVTGSLCENNDKFCVDRVLNRDPKIGDLCIIHTSGAHGHSMGFNYNAKLRHGEILREAPGQYKQIRRNENYEDYFATVADQF